MSISIETEWYAFRVRSNAGGLTKTIPVRVREFLIFLSTVSHRYTNKFVCGSHRTQYKIEAPVDFLVYLLVYLKELD